MKYPPFITLYLTYAGQAKFIKWLTKLFIKKKTIKTQSISRRVLTEKEGFHIEIHKSSFETMWYNPKYCKEKVFKVRNLKNEDVERIPILHVVYEDGVFNSILIVLSGQHKDKLIFKKDCLIT